MLMCADARRHGARHAAGQARQLTQLILLLYMLTDVDGVSIDHTGWAFQHWLGCCCLLRQTQHKGDKEGPCGPLECAHCHEVYSGDV
jgi:hypothetical protein